MSGHSKWSTIKHKKAANDAKKASVFSKMSKAITMAVVESGGNTDPAANVKLRLAIERARAENMPKVNIDRAIEKAAAADASSLKEILYEAIGVSGVGILVAATTDNPNRTNSVVRNVLDKNGGKVAGVNAVAYMFEKCGIVVLSKEAFDETMFFELSDSLSAIEVDEDDDGYVLYIPFEKLGSVHKALGDRVALSVEPYFRPLTTVRIGSDAVDKIEQLVEMLEDLDDVQKAYTNYEVV
ncbi:MAG: YebC/PmpR family DNA-binding transcriptional regulator [Candidatus Roizmanbacteria bacterium]